MSSLKNLKLNFPWSNESDIPPLLIPVLELCTFSLATLYVPFSLLDSWVLAQKQLKVLEIHHHSWDLRDRERQLSICEQLNTDSSYTPTLFLIANFGLLLDRIIAFPAFQTHGQWSAKDIADSIAWVNPLGISHFKLVIRTLSDESFVRNVLKSTAEHFTNLRSIEFLIYDPRIHTSPSSFSSLLQKFPLLDSIYFDYYGGLDKLTPAPYQQNRLGLAGIWATDCPMLRKIDFPDRVSAERDTGDMDWVVVSGANNG
ncbi:hypothetical protein HYPSUDRAFT_200712 [Hypholoma sublateritium FD-334 SS-4]|uniref:Uncharacterized protein n=1 Tax=Hypholoma sublateritium (strain FD-334 SS-4) TaxID=945553 RepID=A0A0D2MKI6_HYPSF|nr:hypothetical protein HYPSUDRAFT_200712 [Hypholoma sublateritium FD-334 SS-4]